MKNEMTYSKAVDYVLANCEMPDDVKEKLTKAKSVLSRKSASKKQTESSKLTSSTREVILELLNDGFVGTVGEMQVTNESLSSANGISNSRISHILTDLVGEGIVKREVVKGKATYSIIEVEVTEDGEDENS